MVRLQLADDKITLDVAGIQGVMLGADYYQVGHDSWHAYPGGMNPQYE